MRTANASNVLDKIGIKKRKVLTGVPDEKFKNIYQNAKFTKVKTKTESAPTIPFSTEKLFDFKETLKSKVNFLEKKRSTPKQN